MRGKRAWGLIEEEWGTEVFNALFSHQRIIIFGKNNVPYMLGEDEKAPARIYLKNMNTRKRYCIEIDDFHHKDYPIGDILYNTLELIRVRPELIEEKAVKWYEGGDDWEEMEDSSLFWTNFYRAFLKGFAIVTVLGPFTKTEIHVSDETTAKIIEIGEMCERLGLPT